MPHRLGVPGPLEDWNRVTFSHPAQGSPSVHSFDPDHDGGTEYFGPAPPAEDVFPAAMFAVPDTAAGAFGTSPDVMAGLPPGHPSGPMPVVPAGEAGVLPVPPPPPPPPGEPEPPRRRRRVAVLLGAVVVVLAGAGAAMGYSAAHKTVTLDVDGEVTTVETFEGDVGDFLTGQGVEVSGRDEVTPALDGALRDGGTVVVRSAHKVTLRADGERQTTWVAALDVDQAFAALADRGENLVLLPSRAAGAAPTLPVPLDNDAPVRLVAGGEQRDVEDGAVALDEFLAAQGVRVDGDDRIGVKHVEPDGPGAPIVTVVVREVQATIEETTATIPFETVTATDPDHYADLGPYLASEGAAGERVTAWDITRVDGRVVIKEKLNTWVSRAPVDKVIMYGTKPRPEPEPEPDAEKKPRAGDDSKAGKGGKADQDRKADQGGKADRGGTAGEGGADQPAKRPEADRTGQPEKQPRTTSAVRPGGGA